jgi:hypothetical protein
VDCIGLAQVTDKWRALVNAVASRAVLCSIELVSYHNFGHYPSSCLLFKT